MQFSSQDIFDGINALRANPNSATLKIKEQLNRFESNTVYRNKEGARIRTMSGKAAWQDAILSLERQKFKDGLMWNQSLAIAVEQYKNILTEKPDSKVSPFQIIKSVCSYEGVISFNINESQVESDMSQLMAGMIVCDGNQEKGTRVAVFHPKYKEFGCAVNYQGKKMAVYMVFAEKVVKGQSGSQKVNYGQQQQSIKGSSQQGKGAGGSSPNANKYARPAEQEAINTRDYYLKAGRQFITQLNKIRKDPKALIWPLKEEMGKFKDDKTLVTDYGIVSTKEGKIPYEDLISELESHYALPTMRQVNGLTFTALEQLLEIESKIPNPTPADSLLDKFCNSSQGIRSIKLTNVQGMPIEAMLLRLIVGDGDRKRTGRKKLLSPICKAIGCAISKDAMVINVGESARDNQDIVEKHRQGLLHAQENVSSQSHQKPSPVRSRNQPDFQQNNSGLMYQPRPGFGIPDPKVLKSYEGDKLVVKRIKKSQTKFENGRKYKVTVTFVLFEDGTEEQDVEEDLIG